MKKIFALMLAVVLVGCASVGPASEKVSESDVDTFFRPPSEGKAAIFFACGTWRIESWLSKSSNPLPSCALQVNGQDYKRVLRDQVGRVDVSPGVVKVQGSPTDSLASYIPLQIEVKNQELVLINQNLLQKIGALGGAASGGFVHTLEWTKQDVIQAVRKKQPVKMTD